MKKLLLPAAISTSMFLAACGGDSNNSANTDPSDQSPATEQVQGKSLVMNVNLASLQSSGLTADKVVVTVSKGEFSETLEISHEDYSATAEFSNLLVGDYQIQVQVYDGDTLVAEGATDATVTANQVAITDMRLELKAGGLVVNVCVPDTAPDTVFQLEQDYTVSKGVEIAGLALGHISEVTTETEDYSYESDLAYSQLEVSDQLAVELAVEPEWELIEGVKYTSSEHNMLRIFSGAQSMLESTGCDFQVEMEYVNTSLTTEGHYVELRFPVKVSGTDQILAGGEPLDNFGGEGVLPPRNITEVTASFRFRHMEGALSTAPYQEVFESGDVAALFDEARFTRELRVENSEYDRHLLSITIGLGVIATAGSGPLEANPVVE